MKDNKNSKKSDIVNIESKETMKVTPEEKESVDEFVLGGMKPLTDEQLDMAIGGISN